MYRRAGLFITALVVSVSSVVLIFAKPAYADATLYISDIIKKAATLNTERNELATCMTYVGWGGADVKYVSPSDLANWKWFSNADRNDWFKPDGAAACKDADAHKLASDLGFTSDPISVACALGITRNPSDNSGARPDCTKGAADDNFYWKTKREGKQQALANIDKVYKGVAGFKSYSGEQYYVMAASLLTDAKVCNGSAMANDPTAQTIGKSVQVVDSTGTVSTVYYKIGGDAGKGWKFRQEEDSKDDDGSTERVENCDGLIKIMGDHANEYAKWIKDNPPGSANNPGSCADYAKLQVTPPSRPAHTEAEISTACNEGVNNKSDAAYCDTKYKDSGQTDLKDACKYGQTKAKDGASSGNPGDSTDNKPTCGIDGIGWAVCPIMNFLAKVNDQAFNFLASYFLSVDTGLIDGTKTAWASFRDIANVCFVIALLFIVYSQVTSIGISNYGIKRMLPRIIIAALLVNISFFICQVAVDLSNILGYALYHFFEGGIKIGNGLQNQGNPNYVAGTLTWAVVIGGVVAGAIGVALAISVPVVIAALLAIGLVVLMLVGRQAFIVLLVAISPLAFVAYLLPNTEQWFKKWYKTFFTMLMLFPTVGVVFGASQMAAKIINSSAQNGGSDPTVVQLIALAVSAVPFFVVPSLLKGSLAATGALGAKLQGLSNKATGRIGKKVSDTSMVGALAKQRSRNQQMKRAQVLSGHAGNRLTRGYYKTLNRATGKYGDRISAQGAATAQKLRGEDVDNEVARMQAGWLPHEELGKATEAYGMALKSGDIVKARAAQKILLSKGNAGVQAIRGQVENLGNTSNDAVHFAKADLAAAGLKSKDAALNAWSYDSKGPDGKGRSLADIDKDAGTYTSLSDSEFATQTDKTMARARTAVGPNGETGLSADRANRILSNPDAQKDLNEDKYRELRAAAGQGATSSASSSTTPAPSTATATHTSSTTPTPPHGGDSSDESGSLNVDHDALANGTGAGGVWTGDDDS